MPWALQAEYTYQFLNKTPINFDISLLLLSKLLFVTFSIFTNVLISNKTPFSNPTDQTSCREEIQGMIEDHERSKHDMRVNNHMTRSREGSLVEEAIVKLQRFKVRTVNILVGGEANEQKK